MALALVFGLDYSIEPVSAKTKLSTAKKNYQKYKKQAKKLGSLKKAKKDLTKKKKALNTANQAYQTAFAAYNTNVTNTKVAYDNALNAYNGAGYDFIMSKATPNYYVDSKNAMANNSVLSQYVNGLDESVKSFLSTTNIKKDIELIKELNNLRATDNNFPGLKALGVDYDLMIFASISGALYPSTHSHTYAVHNEDEKTAISIGENLAWGYSDPLKGWYTEEKALYDAKEHGTGHYLACVGDYDYVGLVLDPSTGASAADFNYVRRSGTQVTVEEFESAFNSYVATYQANVDATKAAYDQAVANKAGVNAAKANVTNAQKAVNKVNAKVKKIKKVNASLKKAKKAYQKALKAKRKRK